MVKYCLLPGISHSKIFTRRLENVTNQFPEVVDYIKKYVDEKKFILDSEAVGYSKKKWQIFTFPEYFSENKEKI